MAEGSDYIRVRQVVESFKDCAGLEDIADTTSFSYALLTDY